MQVEHYRDRARRLSDEALAWSIRDIFATLGVQSEPSPYVNKLLAELDAYGAERLERVAQASKVSPRWFMKG